MIERMRRSVAANNSNSNSTTMETGSTTNARYRPKMSATSLRRRFYCVILLIVFVQALVLPWMLLPTNIDTGFDTGFDTGTGTGTGTSSNKRTDYASPPDAKKNGNHLQQNKKTKPADGTFNGHPMYLQQGQPFHSTVHCVGETHHAETAWMYRSCEFTQLCLDTQTSEFYVIESPNEQQFQQRRVPQSFVSTELSPTNTTTTTLALALGGINPRWNGKDFNQGIEKVRWFPKRLSEPPKEYYQLDSNVVLLPFHSFAAHNVGHMLWDDFLPIFTLLQVFGWIMDPPPPSQLQSQSQSSQPNNNNVKKYHPLLLRVDTLPLLYGTCEMQRKKKKQCAANFNKFLPLLGVDTTTFSTLKEVQFAPASSSSSTSDATMVCSKHAVAGLGMLTDHGLKDHGWQPSQEQGVQNTAKGPLLYQFRNYILNNLDLPVTRIVPLSENNNKDGHSLLRIVLSAHSSGYGQRDTSFENQQRVLQQAFPTAAVQTVHLSLIGMREQIELVSQNTTVFVTTCGGGSMTATFLPKGATLILYYDDKGGFDFSTFNSTGGPAYLDWDLFNNMAYLRVHWLPISTMNTEKGLKALMFLIHHEVDVSASGI
jgi:hypothetical protein